MKCKILTNIRSVLALFQTNIFSGLSTGTGPNSSQTVHRPVNKTDSYETIVSHIRKLHQEVRQLRKKLAVARKSLHFYIF